MRALEEGADGLEVDLHLTRDGEVVCFHDPTVDRTSDGHGPLAAMTWQQMRGLDVHSWKTPRLPAHYGPADQQLMSLQDTLELLAGAGRDVGLALELKHPSPFGHQLEERVLQILLAHGWDPETSTIACRDLAGAPTHTVDVTFMSFYPGSLRHLAELVPAEKLCALFDTLTEQHVDRQVEHLRFSAVVRPFAAAVMRSALRDAEALVWNAHVGYAGPGIGLVRARRAEVKAWQARGLRLRVWTVDSPSDAALLLSLGVEEMTTNYPARMIAAICDRRPLLRDV